MDYFEEFVAGLLTRFYHITALLGMQIKGYEFTSLIFLNQYCPMASTTSSRSGTGDILRYCADLSIPAGNLIGRRKQTRQRFSLIRHTICTFNVTGYTVCSAMSGIGELNVMLIFQGFHWIGEIDITNI